MADNEDTKIAVRNRMNLPFYRAGKDGPSLFSASDRNVEVALMRALANPQIRRGATDKCELSDGNFVIQVADGAASNGGGVQVFRLKDIFDDWIVCRAWDAETESDGDADILIAKPYALRVSLTTETILGLAHTYTYADGPTETWGATTGVEFNKVRTDTWPEGAEDQRVVRPWIYNELIYAVPSDTGVFDDDDTPITLLEVGSGRQWARI